MPRIGRAMTSSLGLPCPRTGVAQKIGAHEPDFHMAGWANGPWTPMLRTRRDPGVEPTGDRHGPPLFSS